MEGHFLTANRNFSLYRRTGDRVTTSDTLTGDCVTIADTLTGDCVTIADILHDGGSVLDYVNWLGFASEEFRLSKIRDIAQFYEIEFDGRILYTIESSPNSWRDIRLAAEAICQHFENRKRFL